MPPLKHTDKEHILPVKMAVIGEKNARIWKVVPAQPPDATPKRNLLLVEWPTRNTEHSFHHFPKLPKELRLQIWEEVLPDPRLVQFQLDDPANVELDGRAADRIMQAWPSSSRQDQLLACRESRAVFRKSYRRLVLLKSDESSTVTFTSDYELETPPDWSSGMAWTPKLFDSRRDTLLIELPDIIHAKKSKVHFDLSFVQNVAFCTPPVNTTPHLFAKAYKNFWWLLAMRFPLMKALTMVYGTYNFNRRATMNKVPKLLDLNSELELMEYGKNSSTIQGIMRSQVRKASMARELFYEVHQESIRFSVARMCFEDLHERRYYEVIDLEPADGRTVEENKTYFTRRPMGPRCGKDLHVYFEDLCLTQHCTTGGDLVSPYDGIEELFREKSHQKRQDEELERVMNWTCYGGKVILY